jgi:hypothetical protein
MRFDDFVANEKLLVEGKEDKGLFKAVFFLGTPGAGKSYVGGKIYGGSIQPRVVNVDKFVEFIDIKNSPKTYQRSKTLTINQFVLYVGAALPLFCDTTGADISRVKNRVRSLEVLGYDTAYVFVNTSLETSLFRASKRTREVPPDIIRDNYNEIQKQKPMLKSLFSYGIEINNDEGELTDDIILKAYKKISYFYDADIQNPVGKDYYNQMVENNWPYLVPNILTNGEIKTILGRWFTSN